MASSAWVSAWNAERLAAGLALIAGYVDAYGFITYKTYLSFMSGNTTQTGSQLGQGHVALAMPSLIAIVFFVIGVFTGTLLAHSGTHHAPRLRFGLVAALMAATIGLRQVGSIAGGAAIAMLGFAMGVMNTTLFHVGAQSVNVGFVTGTRSCDLEWDSPLLGGEAGSWACRLAGERCHPSHQRHRTRAEGAS